MRIDVVKKEEDELVHSLLTTISYRQLLKTILKKMSQEQNLQLSDLIKTFEEIKGEASIPSMIFSSPLEPAEALYKFLKENEEYSYQQIAQATKRNQKSVWATYQRAKKKNGQKIDPGEEKHYLPLMIFGNRTYSYLESVVFYLNTVYNLTNPKIAKLLQKNPSSIAVLMKRARDKHGQK